jgi:hypothetical protein
MHFRLVPVCVQRVLIVGDRFVKLTGFFVVLSHVSEGCRMVRIHVQRAFQRLNGPGIIPQLALKPGEFDVRLGNIGLSASPCGKHCGGFLTSPLIHHQLGQAVIGWLVRRIDG